MPSAGGGQGKVEIRDLFNHSTVTLTVTTDCHGASKKVRPPTPEEQRSPASVMAKAQRSNLEGGGRRLEDASSQHLNLRGVMGWEWWVCDCWVDRSPRLRGAPDHASV